MSTPGASPSEGKEERRKSLGKYMKRMSSVFKREKPGKSSESTPTSAPAAPSTTTPAPPPQTEPTKQEQPTKEEATSAAPVTTTTTTSPPAAAPAPTSTTTPAAPTPITQQLNRAALQQERARVLFAKYGLTLESHEWISTTAEPITVQRIERPIRMRVHRFCHHCGTTFANDKVCKNCEHKRCKKCPRYPKRKPPADKGKQKEEEPPEAPKKKKKLMTITTKSGDERVFRSVKQRVRRQCHQCQTYFIPPTATVCEQCRHVRCTKCPREPAKLKKWPHGYPGDEPAESETEVERPREIRRVWRKPRMRVHWRCEQCQSHFIPGTPQCPGCGHERCDKCTRRPAKKVKREQQFDPEIVRAVEEKLRALTVDVTSGA